EAYHKRRNGVIRRQLYQMMESARNTKWVANLPLVIKNINETINLTTHQTPEAVEDGTAETHDLAAQALQTTLARRYKVPQASKPLFIGQHVRRRRLCGRFEKPVLEGYFKKEVFIVVQQIESAYQNLLPTYWLQRMDGSLVIGRVPKSELLPIPPMLMRDQFPNRAPHVAAAEIPNDIVKAATDPEDPEDHEGEEEEDEPAPSAPAPRRSLRVQNKQQDEEQYEVENLVARRIRRGITEYRVRYVGYDASYDQWNTREELLETAPRLVRAYDCLHPSQ
ncbi:hypothetical protein HKX48_000435, partial [Thoreauomyces humboldtii]